MAVKAKNEITLLQVNDGTDGADGKMLCGTSSTVAATAAKSVACAEAKSLYAGLTVLVEFSTANTATAPTLNVNSLGAKQIYINGVVAGSSNLFLWGAGAKIQFTYNGTYWIPVGHPCTYYGTSSTAAATAAKTSTIAGIVVCKGTTVGIKFTYANSADSPTLNLSSVGAKAVYTQGVAFAYWQAGATVSFTFDGTYWRVSSEPVYASEVIVGNAAGKNVHIDSSGVDIRNGSTDVASFSEDQIELGKNKDAAAIEMCGGVSRVAVEDECLNILLSKTYSKMRLGVVNEATGDGTPSPMIELSGNETYSEIRFKNFEVDATLTEMLKLYTATVTTTLSTTVYLYRVGKLVWLVHNGTFSLPSANNTYHIANLPIGYRPINMCCEAEVPVSVNAPYTIGRWTLETTGALKITCKDAAYLEHYFSVCYLTNDAVPAA